MKKLIGMFLIVVMVIGVGLLSQASADTVISLIQPGPNQASDEDREYLIDRTFSTPGAPGFGIVGQINVGDSLIGSININTLNSSGANLGGLTPNNELTGVFQVLVTSLTVVPVGAQNEFFFTFGVDPAFAAIYGAGAVVALFEGTTHNYAGDFTTGSSQLDDGTVSRTVPPSSADVSVGPYVSENTLIGTATDGTLFATLGFLGLAGEGMNAQTIPFSLANASVLPSFGFTSGTTFANANLGLNLLTLGPAGAGLVVDRVTPSIFGGTVDFALSQQLRGVSDLDTPFEISSNTNISFDVARVPEPSTLLLLGSGLLGVAALFGRRKMSK